MTGGIDMPDDLGKGFYVRPSVFAGVTPRMRIAQEEIFGPVVSIMAYDDLDEAIEIANSTRYGLSGGVFGRDMPVAQAVAKRLRTGQVDINGMGFNPLAPFGGSSSRDMAESMGRTDSTSASKLSP